MGDFAMRLLSQRFVSYFLLVVITLVRWRLRAEPDGPCTAVSLDAVSASEPLRDGLQIQVGPAVLRITALRSDIIRVRISPNSVLPEDASWAVLPDARTNNRRAALARLLFDGVSYLRPGRSN